MITSQMGVQKWDRRLERKLLTTGSHPATASKPLVPHPGLSPSVISLNISGCAYYNTNLAHTLQYFSSIRKPDSEPQRDSPIPQRKPLSRAIVKRLAIIPYPSEKSTKENDQKAKKATHQNRIHKPHNTLPQIQPLLINHAQNTTKNRRGTTGSKYQLWCPIYVDDVVDSVCCNVGVAAGVLGCVVFCGIGVSYFVSGYLGRGSCLQREIVDLVFILYLHHRSKLPKRDFSQGGVTYVLRCREGDDRGNRLLGKELGTKVLRRCWKSHHQRRLLVLRRLRGQRLSYWGILGLRRHL